MAATQIAGLTDFDRMNQNGLVLPRSVPIFRQEGQAKTDPEEKRIKKARSLSYPLRPVMDPNNASRTCTVPNPGSTDEEEVESFTFISSAKIRIAPAKKHQLKTYGSHSVPTLRCPSPLDLPESPPRKKSLPQDMRPIYSRASNETSRTNKPQNLQNEKIPDVTANSTSNKRTSPSSSDIETADFSSEASSPFPNFSTINQAPNEPLYPAAEQNVSIIQRIVETRDQMGLFSEIDYFQEHMEERMVRWRPSESQQNNDITIDGSHPFQVNDFGGKRPGSAISVVKQWFRKESTSETQSRPIRPKPFNMNISQNNASYTEILNCINNFNLHPNTSNSIVPATTSIERAQIIVTEPTPRALPVSELNFDKVDSFANIHGRVNNLSEDMDQFELCSIIGRIQHSVSSSIQSIWGCISNQY